MSLYRASSVQRYRHRLVVALATILLLGNGCSEKVQPGDEDVRRPPDSTSHAVVVENRVEATVERASGTVASSHETVVSSKILSRIEEIKVAAGSIVRQGDILVRLDDRDLKAQKAKIQEDLKAAKARLDLSVQDEDRIQKLFEAEVASQEQLDQVHAARRVAQADVRGALQRVADAEAALSYAEIRTPVNGRVVDRLAEPGDIASPGVALLRIYDPSALRLEVPVRESLAVSLRVGQRLRVYLDAIDESLEGPIEEIVPFAEPGARTLLVKVRLPDDARLFAGMFGRLEVPAGSRARLLIPEAAVTRIGQLTFATALASDDEVERRWITTGQPEDGGRIEVLSGLTAGEHVLVAEEQ